MRAVRGTQGLWLTLLGLSLGCGVQEGSVGQEPEQAASMAQSVINPSNGRDYLFISTGRSWEDAALDCASRGRYTLATINDTAENDWVRAQANLISASRVWIGLHDRTGEGSFVWQSGESPAPSYRNWDTGEPNDLNAGEDCVEMRSTGRWNDFSCRGSSLPYVCEQLPTSAPAVCGNYVAEGGEQCDDGNTFNGDGCSYQCAREPFKVALGDYFAFAQRANGALWSWGGNAYGQLGDGTSVARRAPGLVLNLGGSTLRSVDGGTHHAVAARTDGTVWTWGYNVYGELGNGTTNTTANPTPAQLPTTSLNSVVQVAASEHFTLALRSDGTVWAWGLNGSGQLGNNTTANSSTPVQVQVLTEVVAITAGGYHGLALRSDGTVWAWGFNGHGELGDGFATSRLVPVQAEITNVVAIAAGQHHSLALKRDGTVWAWGHNGFGQLGDGTTTHRLRPVQVTALGGGHRAIAAGDWHSMALAGDGTVFSWGHGHQGQIGNTGIYSAMATPQRVWNVSENTHLGSVVAIAAGGNSALALRSDGSAWTWGQNSSGELGEGTTTQFAYAVRSLLPTECGNGYLENPFNSPAVEQCDDGNTANRDGCSSMCQVESGPVVCGNGVREGSEQCDDGNRASGDGCSYTCEEELPRLAVGGHHALSIRGPRGALWTTGYNGFGQLGDGSNLGRMAPTPVSFSGMSSTTTLRQVAAGHLHSALVDSTGALWTWGYNGYGQLGRGTADLAAPSPNPHPVRLASPTQVRDVSAGDYSTTALRTDGTVWAWGHNAYGQLGNGTYTDSTSPVQVQGLSGVVTLASGGYHTLALRADGTVWAWGFSSNGEVGDGAFTSRTRAVQVPGLSNIVAIAAGQHHSLALRLDGTVWAWGNNGLGQLGDGTTISRPFARQVPNLTSVRAIAAGDHFSLALRTDGTVWAWGLGDHFQIGNGHLYPSGVASPVQVYMAVRDMFGNLSYPVLSSVVAIGAGGASAAALRSDHTLWAWGSNDYGQLGEGTTERRPHATRASLAAECGNSVLEAGEQCDDGNTTNDATCTALCLLPANSPCGNGTLDTASGEQCDDGNRANGDGCSYLCRSETRQVAMSDFHSLALCPDGTLSAWGYNAHGQVGDGTSTSRLTPVRLTHASLSGLRDVAAGDYHSVALTSSGTVLTWGYNAYGQLGSNTTTNSSSPVAVSGVTARDVAAGEHHTVALTSSGAVLTWGYNAHGQLGDGTTTNRLLPTTVAGLSNVVAVAAGEYHTLALRADGTVWAWGENGSGQLGDGSYNRRTRPVQAADLSQVVAIAAGQHHSLALRVDGSVWAWGYNGHGQLGVNNWTQSTVPVQVLRWHESWGWGWLSGVEAIAAGDFHSSALSSGNVWSWGRGEQGQIGTGGIYGPNLNEGQPSALYARLSSGAALVSRVSLASGGASSLSAGSDGQLFAWGFNAHGQLGDGTTERRPHPTLINLSCGTPPPGGGTTPPPGESCTQTQITNGSFEEATCSNFNGGYFASLHAGETCINGWVVGGSGVDYKISAGYASARSIDMNQMAAGSVRTTLNTVVGAQYTIQFAMAANTGGHPVVKTMSVQASGNEARSYSFDSTGKGFASGWELNTYTFTATTTRTTLTFTSTTPDPFGPVLDAVSISSCQ